MCMNCVWDINNSVNEGSMLIYLSTGRHHNHGMTHACVVCCIGVAGSFSEGGQQFRPAKIQSFPANIFSCQGGPNLPILFCHAKLLCQTVLPMGKHCRWMAAKQSKIEEKQENMVETIQKWQKTDKNDRKPWKMWSFANYFLPRDHFCPAKLPFLSCQAPISILPSSHFCPAKLTNFSKGAPPSYTYGVLLTSMVKIINASELIWQLTPIHCWYGLRWKDTFPRYLTFVDNYLLEYLSNRANASSGGF